MMMMQQGTATTAASHNTQFAPTARGGTIATPAAPSASGRDGTINDGHHHQADAEAEKEIRSLKQNLVDNVRMIRKMFSIEQDLRKDLDNLETENGTLSLRNRQLLEQQVHPCGLVECVWLLRLLHHA